MRNVPVELLGTGEGELLAFYTFLLNTYSPTGEDLERLEEAYVLGHWPSLYALRDELEGSHFVHICVGDETDYYNVAF